jgi:hypothetical protein
MTTRGGTSALHERAQEPLRIPLDAICMLDERDRLLDEHVEESDVLAEAPDDLLDRGSRHGPNGP